MRGKKQKIHIPAAGFTDSTAGFLKYAGFHAKTGSTDSISKSGWREIFWQVEVWKTQEYFVYPQGACRIRKAAKPPTAAQYFKIFKPISWGERPAERRSRLIQRFLSCYSLSGQHRTIQPMNVRERSLSRCSRSARPRASWTPRGCAH